MKLGKVPLPNIEFNPPTYICQKSKLQNPSIDANLDKEFWQQVEWTPDFVDIEIDKPKPAKKTNAKILWDDSYLYIGARLYDNQIWAKMTERDDIVFFDNDFEIFINHTNDTHAYFELEMNALNTVWDLLLTKPYRDGGFPLDDWDYKGMRTAVSIDGELNNPSAENKSWSVELAIPWTAFAERRESAKPPTHGDFWRLNFSRVEWQAEVVNGEYKKVINPATGKPFPEDNWVFAPTGVVNIHYPELWGFLVFADTDINFTIPEIEYLKWDLRKVYYHQRAFFSENGCFDNSSPEGITVEITSQMFQASKYTKDKKHLVSIRQDGLVWVNDLNYN